MFANSRWESARQLHTRVSRPRCSRRCSVIRAQPGGRRHGRTADDGKIIRHPTLHRPDNQKIRADRATRLSIQRMFRTDLNSPPKPDRCMAAIADYVSTYAIEPRGVRDRALLHARHARDAAARGAVRIRGTKLLRSQSPEKVVPNGAKVPGTSDS